MRAEKRQMVNIFLRLRRRGAVPACVCALCAALAAGGCFAAGAERPAAVFPLQTDVWRLSGGYGLRADPIENGQELHRGVDLACAEGTPVLAAMEGMVAAAGHSGSYGNYLRLCHAAGRETLYAHLQYVYARQGEVVCAGQVLGTAGSTGRATGAHLHFELVQNGSRCNPAALLGL